jgi:hypothetical protein
MTAVTTRWQHVDGQYSSLCAALNIRDEGILGYSLQEKDNEKENKSRIRRHNGHTETQTGESQENEMALSG